MKQSVQEIRNEVLNTEPEAQQASNTSTALAAVGETQLGGVYVAPWRWNIMRLAYGTSKIVIDRKCHEGSIVLGSEDVIAEPGQQLVMIPLAKREAVREWYPGNPPQGYQIAEYATVEAAKAAGCGFGKGNTGTNGKNVAPCVYVSMLIEKPEKLSCGLFCQKILDRWYAPAIFRLEKTMYGRGVAELDRALSGALPGIPQGTSPWGRMSSNMGFEGNRAANGNVYQNFKLGGTKLLTPEFYTALMAHLVAANAAAAQHGDDQMPF